MKQKKKNLEEIPSKFEAGPWIYSLDNPHETISYDINTSGKWMLFYKPNHIDKEWEKINFLLKKGKLHGVPNAKVSTRYNNPRASNEDFVIILYCGGSENQILNIGRNILKQTLYKKPYRPGQPSFWRPYIYFKSDFQTFQGTAATGCKKNWKYRLPCEWED